jgi:hypothetical protein
MSAAAAVWATTLLCGLVMLLFAVKTEVFSLPSPLVRCSACRRLFRRGTTCPCARPRDD